MVIAIIGILIASCCPKQAARKRPGEPSARIISSRSAGLCTTTTNAHKAFPLGMSAGRQLGYHRSAVIMDQGALPQLELKSVYDTFDHEAAWWHPNNQTVRGIKISVLTCPSDIDAEVFK